MSKVELKCLNKDQTEDKTHPLPDKATICVVNYQTLEYTRLCLRSIRKFTQYPIDIIVVDNDSKDESVEYLRSLSWITLLERTGCNDKSGGDAHAGAIDLALQHCNTEFFVCLHSDTFVHRQGWLTNLISNFNDETACVGSGKIEMRPQWIQYLKKLTDVRKHMKRLTKHPSMRVKYRYYNRTICCIYRTEILRKQNLTFSMQRDIGLTPGKKLYFELVDRGFQTVELPPAVMRRRVWHISHATKPVVTHDSKRRRRTDRKKQRRLKSIMSKKVMQQILQDKSLDL